MRSWAKRCWPHHNAPGSVSNAVWFACPSSRVHAFFTLLLISEYQLSLLNFLYKFFVQQKGAESVRIIVTNAVVPLVRVITPL
jgi:hypothetical protein